MIIKTKALFTSDYGVTNSSDEMSELLGEVLWDGGEKLYPTPFIFDFSDVIAIFECTHSDSGYVAVVLNTGRSYSIKMTLETAERLYQLCH